MSEPGMEWMEAWLVELPSGTVLFYPVDVDPFAPEVSDLSLAYDRRRVSERLVAWKAGVDEPTRDEPEGYVDLGELAGDLGLEA